MNGGFSIVYEHWTASDPNPNKVSAINLMRWNKVNTDL